MRYQCKINSNLYDENRTIAENIFELDSRGQKDNKPFSGSGDPNNLRDE